MKIQAREIKQQWLKEFPLNPNNLMHTMHVEHLGTTMHTYTKTLGRFQRHETFFTSYTTSKWRIMVRLAFPNAMGRSNGTHAPQAHFWGVCNVGRRSSTPHSCIFTKLRKGRRSKHLWGVLNAWSLAHQQHFFEWVQNRTPNVEVPFQLHSTEFPYITAEVERRGWHYLCNPIQGRLGITLLRQFYANAKKTKRERALNPLVYISHIRGKELDYSPESLKLILQLPDVDVEGPSYEARRNSNDLRLGDVLRDIGEEHAQWKLDIKGNPCQLRRHDLKPTRRGWLDFVRRSLMPTSNANEVKVERAVLIHSIMEGLSIKSELLISKHISAAAESKDPNKRLPFTGVIYRLLYANGFKKKVQGDELIPIERPITAESIMKNSQQ
ncbi:hypothetical protein PIB30_063935 [Stylosanthes scabra]|uniref:Putative plant transposon protein domain-containing protein n=1 Tax=Stylosanthes scabra TaxID=79078 RepID=A0ABU6QLF0_9FABA|nr:hypothetical protein [Stylosanthes scabra]